MDIKQFHTPSTCEIYISKLIINLTTDWMTVVHSPVEAMNFYCSLCVKTSSGANQASYSMGTKDPFPG
jgi:hypothetical protein